MLDRSECQATTPHPPGVAAPLESRSIPSKAGTPPQPSALPDLIRRGYLLPPTTGNPFFTYKVVYHEYLRPAFLRAACFEATRNDLTGDG